MESKTNYKLVGLIVLILTAGILSASLWLSAGFNSKTYYFYTVYLHEAAAGLSEESAVKYNGVQVGYVKAIKLNKNDPRQVEITLSIEQGIPVTTSTSATLISQGITGVTYVGLSASTSDLTPIERLPGEPYPVIPAKPSLFNQLDAVLKEASESINKVGNEIARVFTEENAEHLRQTLANLSAASKDFPALIKDLKSGINRFNAMSLNMSSAGKSVTDTMHSGKNTLDKMSQQTIPQATLLLRKLNTISANLEKVSNEMRQNPSIFIRGTKPPVPGPGE